MATAVRVRIFGLVHGVSFRASMASVAADLGVKGWVRNLPDGSVEAHLEGDDSEVKRVLEWAKTGPPRSKVEKVVVIEERPRNHRGFRVRG